MKARNGGGQAGLAVAPAKDGGSRWLKDYSRSEAGSWGAGERDQGMEGTWWERQGHGQPAQVGCCCHIQLGVDSPSTPGRDPGGK